VYGAVKRVLSDRDIVILDGLNYIKGWRYQLHCEAKAVRTVSCVVQVGCGVERARGVNEARLRRRECLTQGRGEANEEGRSIEGQEEQEDADDAEPYGRECWENLVFRYEEPNPMTRWDSPLFPIVWDDAADQTGRIFDQIWEAIAGGNRKTVQPNQATIQRTRDVGADYLYVLDKETQDVVKKILEAGVSEGGDVRIPIEAGKEEIVEAPAGIGLARLQRLRRAFVGLNRGGIGLEGVGNMDVRAIRASFVRYLNDAFEREGE
jgi:protein KTI12